LTCENETISIKDEECFVHKGIYRSAQKIVDPEHPTSLFYAVKSALEENPEYGLVLVGHSLGIPLV
jgi:hypothetical protein